VKNKIWIIFLLLGSALSVGAIFAAKSTVSFLETAVSESGQVVDFVERESDDSTTYAPVVAFTDQQGNEIEFVSSTSSNPPSYRVGEYIEVLYAPQNPHDAQIDSTFSLWGGSIIMAVLGIIFLTISAILVTFARLQRKKEAFLREHGTKIQSSYQDVELNESLSVNGRHPYRITSQWLDPHSNTLHVFKSENLWFDPSDFINSDDLLVYIDPNNPKKYLLDISFLPKVA